MARLLHGVLCDLFNEFITLNIEFIKFLVERDASFMLRASHRTYYGYGHTAYGLYTGSSTSHPYRIG